MMPKKLGNAHINKLYNALGTLAWFVGELGVMVYLGEKRLTDYDLILH